MGFCEERRKDVAERFATNVAEHSMEVIRDDGLYRHLKFSKNGSAIYCFHVHTWPGFLCVTGDMGEWVWSRIPDMFTFVRGSIGSESYFTEKLQAADVRGELKEFHLELWHELESVLQETYGEYGDEKTCEELSEVFADEPESLHDACTLLYEDSGIDDVFEYFGSLTDYNYQYLWTLQALEWAVNKYASARTTIQAVLIDSAPTSD